MTLEINIIPDVLTVEDESIDLQNTDEGGAPLPGEDNDDNDHVAQTDPNLLPSNFFQALENLNLINLDSWVQNPIGVALSGYDGTNDGLEVFNINDPDGFGIDNLAFTQDALGTPFLTYDPTDLAFDPTNGVDSGLLAINGGNIYLFVDVSNDNIVYGIDSTGDIVFAVYLDENQDKTAAKMWTVEFEPMVHQTAGDGGLSYDDSIDLTDKLFVTASQELQFDLTNAPSGQNLFIMFGDGNITDDDAEVGIIATGKNPANVSAGEGLSSGDTINTSQAGGPTSFAVNNQQINEGEGIYFTFVTGPNSDFTVPNLDQTEADIEANINFTGFLGAQTAAFQVVQTVSGKTAVVKITAYNETQTVANASGNNFVDALNNDDVVDIDSVVVNDLDGDGKINIIDNGDGTFNIEGVEAGDTIQYSTVGNHNRVLIENDGDGKGKDSADFDIGGFKLFQAGTASLEVGSTVHWEDSAPSAIASAVTVNLQTDDSNTPDDTDTQDFSGNFTFNAGNDGQQSLVYDISTTDSTDSGLTSGGVAILLFNDGSDGVIGTAGGTTIFSVTVDSSGVVTLEQDGVIDHLPNIDPSSYNESIGLTGSDKITLTATLTDGDNDVASGIIDLTSGISFLDDGLIAFSPFDTEVFNDPTGTGEAFLDSDDNIDDNYGKDGANTVPVRFVSTLDGQSMGETSGGEDIVYYLTDNNMKLVGATGGDATTGKVFEITLSLDGSLLIFDDKYNVTMFASIDNGSGFEFDDLSGVSAGNPDWAIIGDETDPNYNPPPPVEILVTAYNASTSLSTTVNTNSSNIAASSNNIKYQEVVRLDFGEFTPNGDGTFSIGNHTTINGLRFSPQQVSGNPGTTKAIVLTAFDANDDDNFNHDPIDPITGISIDTNNDGLYDFEWETSDGNTIIGGVQFITNPSEGDILLNGVKEDWDVLVHTDDGFSRLEIGNFSTKQQSKFSIGDILIEEFNQGSDITKSYQLEIFDGDSDSILGTVFDITWTATEPLPII